MAMKLTSGPTTSDPNTSDPKTSDPKTSDDQILIPRHLIPRHLIQRHQIQRHLIPILEAERYWYWTFQYLPGHLNTGPVLFQRGSRPVSKRDWSRFKH